MSSSSKKKRALAQCRFCGNYFLAKDLDSHQFNRSATSTPVSSGAAAGRKRQNVRNGPLPRTTETNGDGVLCDAQTFLHSQIAVIQPGKGLALLRHNFGSALVDVDGARERQFPIELTGWMRRHAALVNPETLNALEALPRSAVLLLADQSSSDECLREVLMLWPSTEIPPMKISLPSDCKSGDSAAGPSNLIRLTLVSKFLPSLTKVTLKPNPSESDASMADDWTKLAALAHFPFFLRSYFACALMLRHQEAIEVYYYGRKLLFNVKVESESNNEMGVEQLEDAFAKCILNGSTERNEEETAGDDEEWHLAAALHRFAPMCTFAIDWSEVGAQEKPEEEDPESLL